MTKTVSPSTLIHIPHASKNIPDDLRNQFVLNDAELSLELDRLTDHFTDELFSSNLPNTQTVVFPVSRFVVDPERFSDDSQEPMAERGQGVIYAGTTHNGQLRRELSSEERNALLERFYVPHHETLTSAVDKSLEDNGFVTIIDCHSFPDVPLPVDLSQEQPRPDICIGTDKRHTPGELVELVRDHFLFAGYSVEVDAPYAGTIVPLKHYGKDVRASSIMIEINRRLYLDDSSGVVEKSNQFTEVNDATKAAIESIDSWRKG